MDINTCFATTEMYRHLALYSHLIPAAATFVLGIFAYIRATDRIKAITFFSFTSAFTAWLIADLVAWVTDPYNVVAAFWAPLDYIEIVFFLLLFLFICIDFFPRTLPRWLNPLLLAAVVVPFLITISGNAVYELNQPMCEMVANPFIGDYKIIMQTFLLGAVLILAYARMRGAARDEKIRVALIATSVIFFMGVFAGSGYIATITNIYEINLYTLFSLPVFVLMLTIAITSYQTFRLGDAAVKVLFYVFLVLAGTQFFYVQNLTDFLLALTSFFVIFVLGVMLFRSNEREIVARRELELANQQQESLLHFISHEVKGFLTKSEAGFASIVEGDYGEVAERLKRMAEAALSDTRRGVDTVMEILDASNLRRGTMNYDMKLFDFKKLVEAVIADMRPAIEERGLKLAMTVDGGEFSVEGDEPKLRRHVVRNLLDNAVRYTPEGSIHVALSHTGRILTLTVADTGVGITEEDKAHLFTEGGKGKESTKVNVDSTGYGLFIAKSVVEKHGGMIHAESKGRGKGSSFIVELPTQHS